jgi:hypothetical protein
MIEMKQTARIQNQCKLGNLLVNLWRLCANNMSLLSAPSYYNAGEQPNMS